MLLLCIGGTVVIVVITSNALLASPVVVLSFALLRHIRWVMFWQSTPGEKAVLGKDLEREPFLHLLLALIRDRTKRQGPRVLDAEEYKVEQSSPPET